MQSIEYRYNNDPQIHALVDYLEKSIQNLNFTPSEIRECAMLAAIHYEQKNVRKCYRTDGGSEGLSPQ